MFCKNVAIKQAKRPQSNMGRRKACKENSAYFLTKYDKKHVNQPLKLSGGEETCVSPATLGSRYHPDNQKAVPNRTIS